MSPSFLFTALNKHGKQISERVEAETLAAARYKLEIQGYSDVEFLDSEVSNEIQNLFTEQQIKSANNKMFSKTQVDLHFRSGWWHTAFKMISITSFSWLPLLIWGIYTGDRLPFFALSIVCTIMTYCLIPVVILHYLESANQWANTRQVRFWGTAAKWFNHLTVNKIPSFVIDARFALADAREGNLVGGLRRLEKYQDDPKVSKRLLYSAQGSVYGGAKKYDDLILMREKALNDGYIFPEELIDYAIAVGRFAKNTFGAREAVNRLMDMQLTMFANIYLPYCQGLIETEDGNYSKAEFYLLEAQKRMKPFDKNGHLVGIRSMMKAFLSIAVGNQGNKKESGRLFSEAKPFLIAHKEIEILQRCEEASR
jgi:hypothetical protein